MNCLTLSGARRPHRISQFTLRYKGDPRSAAFCRKVGLPVPGEAMKREYDFSRGKPRRGASDERAASAASNRPSAKGRDCPVSEDHPVYLSMREPAITMLHWRLGSRSVN